MSTPLVDDDVRRGALRAPVADRADPPIATGLAVVAVALLAYQAWTLAGWIGDGPFQVTTGRDHESTSWSAARVIEVLVVVSIAGFVVRGVSEHRREGRIGVDTLLVIGVFSSGFWDPVYNWVAPAWLYSSHWLNVNDWFAHAPGIVNPDAGRMPWPIIIVLIGYPLWGVGFAMLVNRVMDAVRERRPAVTARGLASVGFVVAVVLTWVSFGIFKALDLMEAPGFRFPWLGDSDVLFAGFSGGLGFWGLACLRYFRTADGRAIFELGARRPVVRVLSAMAACQIVIVTSWGLLTVPFTLLDPSPYPGLPAHVVGELCDLPGTSGTDYGPCPGSPGFTRPAR